MTLPYPHARNDCEACRERDADVQVLGAGDEDYRKPSERPVLLCQSCLGRYVAVQAIQRGGPELDQPLVISVAVAPGRRTDVPSGLTGSLVQHRPCSLASDTATVAGRRKQPLSRLRSLGNCQARRNRGSGGSRSSRCG